jgi:hypothetical protein
VTWVSRGQTFARSAAEPSARQRVKPSPVAHLGHLEAQQLKVKSEQLANRIVVFDYQRGPSRDLCRRINCRHPERVA